MADRRSIVRGIMGTGGKGQMERVIERLYGVAGCGLESTGRKRAASRARSAH